LSPTQMATSFDFQPRSAEGTAIKERSNSASGDRAVTG
jgi:hypothetical protein